MSELFKDRRRAMSFGSVAHAYDLLRPRYNSTTLAAITQGASTALDVGAGTGILSRQLRDYGLSVTAVEPDAKMAAIATGYGIDTEIATFEDWQASGRTFDVVTFGQSWHWVKAETAIPALLPILNPDGRVVLLWNKLRPTRPTNDDLRAASDDYVNIDGITSQPDKANDALADVAQQFTKAGFSATDHREDCSTYTQPAAQWLDLIFTYSAHSTLPDERKVALRHALETVLGDRDVELAASTIAVTVGR